MAGQKERWIGQDGDLRLTSLSSRPVASSYKGTLTIVNPNYAITSTSNGTSWYSSGYSALLADRPSAADFGVGVWQVGDDIYVSKDDAWSAPISPDKRIKSGVLLTDWTNGSITTPTNPGESFALDNAVTVNGKSCMKCSFATAGGATWVGKITFTTPIYLADFNSIQIPILTESNTTEHNIGVSSHEMAVWVLFSSGSVRFQTLRLEYSTNSGRWAVISLNDLRSDISYSAPITGKTDLLSNLVTGIEIVFFTAAAAAAAKNVWIGPIYYGCRNIPNVTFTFDKEHSSQYTFARQILNQYGIKSSFALQFDAIGTASHMTLAQLQELHADGHEMIHHSYDNKTEQGYGNATDWPTAADIIADIAAGQTYLTANSMTRGLGYGVKAYTNPIGTTLARQQVVLGALESAGIRGMRSIYENPQFNPISETTRAAIDAYHITSQVSLSATSVVATITAWIDKAILLGESIVITSHEIVADTATPAGNQIKASDFIAIVAHVASKVKTGECRNLLFSELSNIHYE